MAALSLMCSKSGQKVLKSLNLSGLIIFCLKWRKTDCSEQHVKGGVLEQQRMAPRLGFTASKCTSCKKSRRAACAHNRLSFAGSIITIDSCFGRKFWRFRNDLCTQTRSLCNAISCFSEVHLSPPFLLLHKKSHFSAQHFIPRRIHTESGGRKRGSSFFSSTAALFHQNVLTSHAMSFKLEKFIRSSKVGGTAASTAGASSLTLSAPL